MLQNYEDEVHFSRIILSPFTFQVPDAPTFVRRLHDIAVKVGTRARLLVEVRSPTEIKVSFYRLNPKS